MNREAAKTTKGALQNNRGHLLVKGFARIELHSRTIRARGGGRKRGVIAGGVLSAELKREINIEKRSRATGERIKNRLM